MSESFDSEHAVATYRQVIGKRDEQTTDPGWIRFNTIAQPLPRPSTNTSQNLVCPEKYAQSFGTMFGAALALPAGVDVRRRPNR